MKPRISVLFASMLLAAAAFAQEAAELPFAVPTPDGWAKETIPLPPSFAPDMKWSGLEELRFAPGWMNADSATFFSYALLFWLPGDQPTDAHTLETQLLTYYRGLAQAVAESKGKVLDVTRFTMSVVDAATPPQKRAGGEEVTAYNGKLKWIEPFTTGREQTLRMEIQVWRSVMPVGNCVFICASSQPETAEVWTKLRAIREDVGPAQRGESNMRVHYLEIVCRDVAAQCAALERVHRLSFGPPVADLGAARVAKAADGSLIGVRAPLAEHEQPIIRTYLEVADIAKAIKDAEAAGGVVAYGPTQQGDTGTWAIYFLGDLQFGLWQK
ncbi:MAG TPA: hypothetical protein VNN55_08760 [bacterium]|nr:hypothetical protein [bacterium]